MSAVLIVTGLVAMAAGIVALVHAEQLVDTVDGWVIGAMDAIRRVREGARS
ncbi:hypothetical protein [Streptomyces niveus]|uniref:hypothetical protein n=1 Tax=Streptomyces niveus TaxID=193462 RepID=UPI0036D2156C